MQRGDKNSLETNHETSEWLKSMAVEITRTIGRAKTLDKAGSALETMDITGIIN